MLRSLAIRTSIALCWLMIALFGGCATQSAPPDALTELLALIDQRLAISEDVARSKWNSGAAIEDLKREGEIVEDIRRQAPAFGLDAAATAAFFQAQIEASKIVQRTRLAGWRAAALPAFAHTADLQRDIRPRLDRLTTALMTALARVQPALRTQQAAARLNEYATDDARAAAIAPLRRQPARN